MNYSQLHITVWTVEVGLAVIAIPLLTPDRRRAHLPAAIALSLCIDEGGVMAAAKQSESIP